MDRSSASLNTRNRTRMVFLVWAMWCGAQAGAAEDPATKAETKPPARTRGATWGGLRGYLNSSFRGRKAAHQRDQDAYQTLTLDGGRPYQDQFSLHLAARGQADIDGYSNSRRDYFAFDGLADGYHDRASAQLYAAHAALHRTGPFEDLRLGRQRTEDAPQPTFFDGLHAGTRPLRSVFSTRIAAYGGSPTHLYERSPSGDWLGGARIELRPCRGGRVAADYQQIRDVYLTRGTHESEYWGGGLWQTCFDRLLLHGYYTRLDGRDREVKGRVSYDWTKADARIELRYAQRLAAEREQVLDLEYFTNAVQERLPYHDAQLVAWKGLGQHFSVETGGQARRLKDGYSQTTYNHEFERYYLSPALRDLGLEGLGLALTGEVWRSRNEGQGFDERSAGGELSYKVKQKWEVAGGSSYALFRYDALRDLEQEDVRVYYGRLKLWLGQAAQLTGGYEVERDEFRVYQVAKLGLSYRF